MAPQTAQKEAGELLEQLPWPPIIIDGTLVNNHDLKRTRWRAQAPLAPRRPGQSVLAPRRRARNRRQVLAAEAVFGWHHSDDARFEDWDDIDDPEDKLTSLDGEDLDTEVSADLNVEGVHKLWRNADPQPRHPLAPLVRAWWKRPQHIEADTHPDAILPAGTLQHAPSSATYRSLEVGGDRTHEPEQFELAYPGGPGKVAPETVQLDLLPAEHADVPVTPLLLADAAGFSELQQAAPVSTSAYFSMPWRRCRCLHGFPEAATCGNRPWRKSAISCGRNPRAPASRAGNLQSTISPCTKLSTR